MGKRWKVRLGLPLSNRDAEVSGRFNGLSLTRKIGGFMRLSTAIMLGRTTIAELTVYKLDGCALGMAANAAGIERDYLSIGIRWPWLGDIIRCPFVGAQGYGMVIVAYVFDCHVMRLKEWTMEQLCDWVRSVEPPDPEDHYGIKVEADPTVCALSNGLVFATQAEAEDHGRLVASRFPIGFKRWEVFPTAEPVNSV
jgi:hypothetical protein